MVGGVERTPMTVLIIDDHPVFRDGVITVLEQEPSIVAVSEAASYQDAIRAVHEVRPDVAIVDISLKDGNGLELLADIRSRSPQTRCIVLSVHVDPGIVSRAFSLGAFGFISKGAGRDELLLALERVNAGHTYLDAEAERAFSAGDGSQRTGKRDWDLYQRLTEREREVFLGLAEGKTRKQIAYDLGISRKTVDVHHTHINDKLGTRESLEIVRMAARLGLIDLEKWSRDG
jgi:DNA-binding NarL/FixJ family response regulator